MVDEPNETPPLPKLAEEVARIAPPAPLSTDEIDDLEEFGPKYSLKDIRQLRAIRAFLRTGKVKDACAAAGVKYGAWYRWLDEDPEFAHALERAKDIRANELEEIAEERARESSDTLLLALLKALRPEKYRDRQTITVVSPDVVSRLQRQADAILQTCKAELDPETAARVASRIAERLQEVWS